MVSWNLIPVEVVSVSFFALNTGMVTPPVFSCTVLPARVLNNKFLLFTENSIDEGVSSVGLVNVPRIKSLEFVPSTLVSLMFWANRISRTTRSIMLSAFELIRRSVRAWENAAVTTRSVLMAKSEINARIAP